MGGFQCPERENRPPMGDFRGSETEFQGTMGENQGTMGGNHGLVGDFQGVATGVSRSWVKFRHRRVMTADDG